MIAIVLSLACAFVYGSADFIGGTAARRAPLFGVTIVSQSAGLILLCAVLPLFGPRNVGSLAIGALAGVFGAGGILLLYAGLAVGRMGIVSPVTAGLAAAFPVIWGLLHGESPSILSDAGLACAFVAIILVSLSPDEPGLVKIDRRFGLPAGLLEAIASGLFLGGFFVALGSIGREGALVPLVMARFASICTLLVVAVALRRNVVVPRIYLPQVLVCGILDMLANVLFVLALRTGMLAIVAILSSLYPAATVALSATVHRERLSPPQWAGVGLALTGIALIAA
ncbi:MAG TPA: DMT family transporter [Candidatus Acidoferrales bacterium]|nr:DMT family transporter [Candidatus Acidoferrales bacterium]